MRLHENRREIAAFALATGHTAASAAKRARVTERTVREWLTQDEYRERVRVIRSDILERVAGEMANVLTCATATLRALLNSDSHTVRLGAARTILDTGMKYHEALVLEDRIKKLEAGESSIETEEAGAGQGTVDHSTEEDGPPADPVPTTA